MQKHPELTRQRITRFAAKMPPLFYPERKPVDLSVFSAPGRITFEEAIRGPFKPARVGEKFGPLWSTHWFHVQGEIPGAWKGRQIHLLWDSSSEACVWRDGVPIQGLAGSATNWGENPIRTEFLLADAARAGERVDLYVEIACNGLFGTDVPEFNDRIGTLLQAEIALFDQEAWDLYWDFIVIAEMAQQLPLNTPRGGQALFAANAMVNALRLDDRSTWAPARRIAREFLSAHNGDGQHNISAIGHAHIDTAWLWPVAETKRKCARSFSTALRYMDLYPGFRFACSQAQQYAWMKQEYPGLYERIREKVKAGSFIPVGGTWVEPDCNIPSGESLVRQFLYGQRFFLQEFGRTCEEFWNPDVFGYSGALPQIMRLAGIRYFLTQKLSWNQFNKPASHTFLWEGIDGSRVLTHFPPADTYNSTVSVKELLHNVSNFKDHERARESLLLFGYGDGGGGPTLSMLERLARLRDVDGLPRVEVRAPAEFFARCEADLRDPLVWAGELYFELHRGTYTSQARNKRFNRQSELLLRDTEFLAALAFHSNGSAYPAAELETLWKLVLTDQFHDILPGSSIGEVYQDSAKDYEQVLEAAGRLRQAALADLAPGDKAIVWNTLSFARAEVIELPEGLKGGQISFTGRALGVAAAPPMGCAPLAPEPVDDSVGLREEPGSFTLENARLRAVFTRQGGLVSLFHKGAQREAIAADQIADRFVLYEDEPNKWDAWDVDAFHLEKPLWMGEAVSVRVLETGPLRASLEFTYSISPASSLRQTVSLSALSSRLEFACEADWHERHKFLKVEFPVNVRAQQASYEIQFGHLQRPTHFNTSWDMARFEVSAHKWADLSEPGFGVALLNDCKYGHAAHGNILRLSLLRAPLYPDPEADQGRHEFRFALYPHQGSLQSAGVVEQAYAFNLPLLAVAAGKPEQRSFFSVDNPAAVIDTVKKAEEGDSLIIRLYESHGSHGRVRLSSSLNFRSAVVTDLLENELSALAWSNGATEFDVSPFQIVTLKLSR